MLVVILLLEAVFPSKRVPFWKLILFRVLNRVDPLLWYFAYRMNTVYFLLVLQQLECVLILAKRTYVPNFINKRNHHFLDTMSNRG